MAFLSSMDISGSALTAERVRMDVISENIANATTTRTEEGGPYRRKMVIFEHAGEQKSFRRLLEDNLKNEQSQPQGGVKVARIVEDPSEFNLVYDPTSPDADENGYVKMPNVDQTKETLDMMSSTTSYNANLTAFNAIKTMASKALEMGR